MITLYICNLCDEEFYRMRDMEYHLSHDHGLVETVTIDKEICGILPSVEEW